MNWKKINSLEQVKEIKTLSETNNVLIFKHSTRCPTSSMALNRLERNWEENYQEKIQPYFLDLIKHRDISNYIASEFDVMHESPQAILIQNRQATFNTSHLAISLSEIIDLC